MIADLKAFPPQPAFKPAAPPAHLSKKAAELWRKLILEYDCIDEHGLLLLTTALESYDGMNAAREVLKRTGLVEKGTGGRARAHPATTLEKNYAATMLACFKALKSLEASPPPYGTRTPRPRR